MLFKPFVCKAKLRQDSQRILFTYELKMYGNGKKMNVQLKKELYKNVKDI